MSSLIALLGKPRKDAPASDSSSEDAAPNSDGAFNESATQAMDCLKNNDTAGFAEALRSCIELSQ